MLDLTLERLLSIERRGWDSLCRSEGGTFYGHVMTPDALMILPNGMVMDRDAIAGSLNESPPWASYELENARVVPASDHSAALVYKATATREGEALSFTALMSSVYCLLDGEIRLVLYQQTTITH
ncbi:nuclear transport factor 2 family protein [Kineococcus esterisolvens]|uniref:nuclear transport factor 2 family protein n=1 Tax=unclassified Kineococcus TaxID=2621656 RepID=UPI003D7CA482